MRALTWGDLGAALATVMAAPPDARAALAQRIVSEADTADRWRKRLRRAHPCYGLGSLMTAAQGHPQLGGAPTIGPAEAEALVAILRAWGARRGVVL